MNRSQQRYQNRCPYCNLTIEKGLGDSFECPRCGGTGAVRANDRGRYIVAAELVERVEAGARRDAERASRRRARTAVELREWQDRAAGAIADARAEGGMVSFSPAVAACSVCAQLEGQYEPDTVPSLPGADCTGDGWAADCRCSVFASSGSVWERREAAIIETLWDAGDASSEEELAARTRLPLNSLREGLRSLVDGGYASVDEPDALGHGIGLRPRGLREMGDWPSERGYAGLVAVLEYMASGAGDEQEDWAELLSAVRRAGHHLVQDVMYAVLRQADGDLRRIS